MYTLICRLRSRPVIAVEAVSAVIALVTAEAFYKFHSFSLECVAFLATWFCLSGVLTFVIRPRGPSEPF